MYMNNFSFSKKYIIWIITLIVFLLLLLILVTTLSWIKRNGLVPLNREDSGIVVYGFVEAMMQNQVEKAKALVAEDQLQRVEQWMSNHLAVHCSPSILDGPISYGGGSEYLDGGILKSDYQYTIALPCPDMSTYYCLSVNNIELQQTKNGWQIVDWGEVTEFFGSSIERDC